jgi:hypothetical protein
LQFVIEHENAHLKRKDQLSKPLGFLLLAVYWFNPVLWIAYVLLCRDIESACDERVIKEMSAEARKGYSEALVACSVHRRAIMACPLAFGEVGVKDRIKSVLSYKKPAFWIIVAALVISLVVAVCFMTDPFEYGIGKRNCGIVGFDITQNFDGGATLTFKYLDVLGYSVSKCLNTDDRYIHIKDPTKYKSFGKYFIQIQIYDASSNSQKFMKEINALEKINPQLNIRSSYPDDSTIVIYIGSDYPLITDEVENTDLNMFGGSFKVKIGLDKYGKSSVSFVRFIDFGSNVDGLDIEPLLANVTDGNLIFDIKWINGTSRIQSIGPNFKIYRKQNGEWIALDHNSIWLYYQQLVDAKSETIASYNITAHFSVYEPGTYRMEIYEGWIEFEVYENSLEMNEITKVVVRTGEGAVVDISGSEKALWDGLEKLSGEYCGNSSDNAETVVYEILIYTSDDLVIIYTLQENSIFTVEKYHVATSHRLSRNLWRDDWVNDMIKWLNIFAGVYDNQ